MMNNCESYLPICQNDGLRYDNNDKWSKAIMNANDRH